MLHMRANCFHLVDCLDESGGSMAMIFIWVKYSNGKECIEKKTLMNTSNLEKLDVPACDEWIFCNFYQSNPAHQLHYLICHLSSPTHRLGVFIGWPCWMIECKHFPHFLTNLMLCLFKNEAYHIMPNLPFFDPFQNLFFNGFPWWVLSIRSLISVIV